MKNNELKQKALTIIKTYFDNPEKVQIKDEIHGFPEWKSIKDPAVKWTYLGLFIKYLECYRVYETNEEE